MLMRKQIPFYKQLMLYTRRIKKSEAKVHSPPATKLLPFPKVLSKFAPVSPMIKHSPQALTKGGLRTSSVLTKFGINQEDSKRKEHPDSKDSPKEGGKEEDTKIEPSKMMKAQHVPWIDASKAQDVLLSPNMNTEVIRLPNTIKVNRSVLQKAKEEKSDLLKSPSLFLRDTAKEAEGGMTYCECGNSCEPGNTMCAVCMKAKETSEYSGYLYLKTKSTKLKRYWYILLNKELYCTERVKHACVGYKNKEDTQHKEMQSLVGTFIKDELEDIFDKKTVLYPFSLYFMHNKKTFYALKKDEKAAWMKALKEAIGYSNLYDFYELKARLHFIYTVTIGGAGRGQVWRGAAGRPQEDLEEGCRQDHEESQHEQPGR